jgi:hypothetical protein
MWICDVIQETSITREVVSGSPRTLWLPLTNRYFAEVPYDAVHMASAKAVQNPVLEAFGFATSTVLETRYILHIEQCEGY